MKYYNCLFCCVISSAPSAAPSNVRYTDVTTDQASFAWDEVPCGSQHGVITEYDTRLVNPADDRDFTKTTSGMLVTFRQLKACTEYSFTVAALNMMHGPMSDEIRIQTDIIGK